MTLFPPLCLAREQQKLPKEELKSLRNPKKIVFSHPSSSCWQLQAAAINSGVEYNFFQMVSWHVRRQLKIPKKFYAFL